MSLTATQNELKRIAKLYKKEYSQVLEDYTDYHDLEYEIQNNLVRNSPYWDAISTAELARF